MNWSTYTTGMLVAEAISLSFFFCATIVWALWKRRAAKATRGATKAPREKLDRLRRRLAALRALEPLVLPQNASEQHRNLLYGSTHDFTVEELEELAMDFADPKHRLPT